ncbi:MAG: DinB family protein [Candidatus Hydrogenedentes bacterium]|nr:DinB family protein [Candidatus Hydrogenedentota bacterium]
MSLSEGLLNEFSHESRQTRKLLERVPEQHFGWKPHDKSMTLGRLASHIAETSRWGTAIICQDEFVIDKTQKAFDAASLEEVLEQFDAFSADFTKALTGQTDAHLMTTWRLKAGGKTVIEMPRAAVLRTMVFNHAYHHRGQLTVYLRMHNVLLPSLYGPSADEPA